MNIVMKEDIEALKVDLLAQLQRIIREEMGNLPEPMDGYKTQHVRKILGCSVNKLVSLRISRKIRVKKIGGTLYYNKDDVKKLLQQGF